MESAHDHGQLTSIAFVALVALLCGLGMTRLKQPAVVGYIVAGVLLGPSGFALVEGRAMISFLAELGVLMLLFLIGMELKISAFKAVWKVALFTTLTQIVVGFLAMLGLSYFLDWPLSLCILLGFVVALSSTAVAIKMLEDSGELETRAGQLTVGVLIAQDLAVVPMMLIVSALGGAQDSEGLLSMHNLTTLLKVVLSIGFLALLIAFLGRREGRRLLLTEMVGDHVDLAPLAGLAFCFGAAAVSGMLGLSAAYGAFLAGLVIGNSASRKAMLRHTVPVEAILLMVFFLSVGLLLDLNYVFENLGTVLMLLFFIIVLKTALNVTALRLFGETWPRAFVAGVSLAQIGEFSFVLIALGLTAGIADQTHSRLIIALTVLSLIVSPLYLEYARRWHRMLLLGVTSGRECLRLTLGATGFSGWRSTQRGEAMMHEMSSGETRWIGDLMPRRGRRTLPRDYFAAQEDRGRYQPPM
jgi:CPA2 family monovalent cation:H+ antiporter-2